MTPTPDVLIVDPESGEVLATNVYERDCLIDDCVRDMVAAAVAGRAAARARRILIDNDLLDVGDAKLASDHPGWAVMVKPARAPSRQVVPARLDEHADKLASNDATSHLAPREVTTTSMAYAKVGDLTNPRTRKALALVGLTPETFMHTPEAGDAFSLEVVGPDPRG